MTATQAPTPGPLWMMHVIGPDDIYPAPDHATAVEWCAALNASVPKNDVLCVAVPAIWIGTPEAHAEGLSEAVEGWTSPRQRLASTAPVEASGSERETEEFFAPFEAFRPQPSGETRSTLTRDQIINALNNHIGAELAGPTETWAEATGIEDAADAILALLSARPLALGRVAQSVEPSAHNGLVAGSNPAATTTPALAEAQDEGAAGELKPCPFCGGEAEIIHLDDGDNAGGSCVCCTKCQASGNVEFGRKENFVDNWNRRAHPSPTPAADADRVRIAVGALEVKINAPLTGPTHGAWDRGRIAGLKEALAALKSSGVEK